MHMTKHEVRPNAFTEGQGCLFTDAKLSEEFVEHLLVVDSSTDSTETLKGTPQVGREQFIGLATHDLGEGALKAFPGFREVPRVAGVDRNKLGPRILPVQFHKI
jgi:hypothetical protein